MLDQKKTHIKISSIGIVRFRRILLAWLRRHNRIAGWPRWWGKPATVEQNVLRSIAFLRRGRNKQPLAYPYVLVQVDPELVAGEWLQNTEKANVFHQTVFAIDNQHRRDDILNPRHVVMESTLLYPTLDAKSLFDYHILKPNHDEDFLMAPPDQQMKKRFEFMRYLIDRGVFSDEIQDPESTDTSIIPVQDTAEHSIHAHIDPSE